MNWLELMPQPAAKPALDAKPSAVPEWSLGQVNVSDGALRWRDESHGKPFNASIDRFNVDLKHLAGQGEIPAEFDVSWSVNADEWLKVEAFSARGGRLHLDKRELALGDVLAKGVRILMRRAADGALDWVKPPSLRAVQASQKEDSVSTAWKLSVASYVGEDVGMRFEDAAVTPAATQVIDGMGFELKNLSTEPGQEVTLATRFKLNRRGQVAIGGTTKLFPFAADLKLDLKTVELLPLQPYFGEKLNVAVTRGQLTLDGNLKLRQGERGQTAGQAAGQTTAGEPALAGGFSGRATIGDFQSVDKASSAEFLRWKSLYFGNIDLRHGPDELSVGEVALTDFFARVIVSPQGKLNLLQVVRQDEAAAVAGEKGGATSGDASPGALAEPGADKLARAVLDALTDAAVWEDDGQVADLHVYKRFADAEGEVAGVMCRVEALG